MYLLILGKVVLYILKQLSEEYDDPFPLIRFSLIARCFFGVHQLLTTRGNVTRSSLQNSLLLVINSLVISQLLQNYSLLVVKFNRYSSSVTDSLIIQFFVAAHTLKQKSFVDKNRLLLVVKFTRNPSLLYVKFAHYS